MGMRNQSSPELDELYDAILSLKTREECCAFFSDIATVPELRALSLRLQVAKQIYFYDYTYDVISNGCGVSAATISRVKNSLLYGKGGYKMILDRMSERESGKEDK